MKKLLLFILAFASLAAAYSPANSSFAYFQVLNLTNLNASYALTTNFTHNVTINTAALISAGKMQSSCNDLWVYYNSSGVTNLNRIVNGCNTVNTYVYFRNQAKINGSANVNGSYEFDFGNTTVVNPLASNESVFWLFDDFNAGSFNSTKWYGSVYSQANGFAELQGTQAINSQLNFSNNTQIDFGVNGTGGVLFRSETVEAGFLYGVLGGSPVLGVGYDVCSGFQGVGIPNVYTSYPNATCRQNTTWNDPQWTWNGTYGWTWRLREFGSRFDWIQLRHFNNASISGSYSHNFASYSNLSVGVTASATGTDDFDYFRVMEYIEPTPVYTFTAAGNGAPAFQSQSFNITNSSAYAGATTLFLSSFNDDSNVLNASLCLNANACVNGTYYNGSATSRYFNVNQSNLQQGTYTGFWTAYDDNSANTNSSNFTLVIANAPPTFNVQYSNKTNSTAFANQTVLFLANASDDSNVVNGSLCVNANACVNGSYYNGSATSRYFNVNNSGLGVGTYTSFWTFFDNQSANVNSSNFTLVIASGTQTAVLLLNGGASNIQITYGTSVNASVVCSAATSNLYDSLQTPTLVVSSQSRGAQLLSQNLSGGIHLFTGQCVGDANFSATNSSVFSVNVQTQDEDQPYTPPAANNPSGNGGGSGGIVGIIAGIATKTVEAVKEITKGVNFGVLAVSFAALVLLLLLVYRETEN